MMPIAGRGFFFVHEETVVHILTQIGLVAFGGALGSLLRWGVALAVARLVGTAFPWGTFAINISGCLFLGWFSTILAERVFDNGLSWINIDNLRPMIAVGFTGAYTTFSTFEYESNQLIQDGDGLKGLTYVFGSAFLGLVAVRLGIMLAKLGEVTA
jgi:CrcB protein